MCGCTSWYMPARRPCSFSLAWTLRTLMRRPRLLVNRAGSVLGGRTASQRSIAARATEPTGMVRVLRPLPVTVTSCAGWSMSSRSIATSSASRRPEE